MTEINGSFFVLWMMFIILVIIIPAQRRNKLCIGIISRKKKGEKRVLPTELMKDFIGKVCSITLFNSSIGVNARIEAIEGNWIKVNEKGRSRLINGDMICNIEIMPDKYQK